MGLPSSGIEYDVLSVRREMSVARSVPVVLSPGFVSTRDSVGAGRIGLRVSTPIVETGFLQSDNRMLQMERLDDYDGTVERQREGGWLVTLVIFLCLLTPIVDDDDDDSG